VAKNVTTIPATRNRYTANPINSKKKRRVAGYARVSTDMEDQQTSYAAQCDYYTQYIQSRDDWEFAGLYSDEGITATNTLKRDGFNKMIEDALAGRIDLIITKSVSRFARNTVDSLSTIRKLKDNGCECYFEKENIWTFDSKGELLITIMSSLAQEESRSISENCTWGWRKRCADGKVTVPFGRFLGYDRGEDGNLVVNQEQAVIVRKIYGYFLQGRSPYQIAKLLTEEGIPTPGGKKVWGKAVVQSILTNEKYKGDALLQKVYTTDFLTKKKKKNEGEVPQYYVEGNHEAIISPEVFDRVQILMQAREPGKNRNSSVSIFSSKIICSDCGSWYGSKVWHSNDKYRKVIWQCNHKFDGEEKCSTPHLDEETIKQIFIKALNILCKERDLIIAGFEEIKDTAFLTDELEAEAGQQNGEMNVVAELIQNCIDENARVAQDQTEYEKRYDTLVQRFDTARAKLEETQAAIAKRQAQRQMMENFMEVLRSLPEQVDYFDEGTWYAMCDYITVYSKDDIRVTFHNGMEIRV
jgi:DNA invertase Pin-like site-specific DNA recombinase